MKNYEMFSIINCLHNNQILAFTCTTSNTKGVQITQKTTLDYIKMISLIFSKK